LYSLFFCLALANNGKGPGDGIPDQQEPGSGFGSPGIGKGEGPGAGKVDSGGRHIIAAGKPGGRNGKFRAFACPLNE